MNLIGQELGISTLILIVLGIILLIFVIVFVLHPISLFSPNYNGNYNMTVFVHNCQVYCSTASSNDPAYTEYCQYTFTYNSRLLHCYNITSSGGIGEGSCTYIASNGSQVTANSSTC